MYIEWDERKRASNIVKHGIDFVRAAKVFDGPTLEMEDRRRDYGEGRLQVLGRAENEILYVVYTWRGEYRRIISARKAGRHEREAYYASIQGQSGKDEG